jgi:hypothetical protein
MPNPSWYQHVLDLKILIDDRRWLQLRAAIKNLIKAVEIPAHTVKTPLVKLFTASSSKPVDINKVNQIYVEVLKQAEIEKQATLFDRIQNEEHFSRQLSQISKNIEKSWRIVWNYWWGTKAKDFTNWLKLKTEFDTTPLTQIGRYHLQIQYLNLGKHITPGFFKMLIQLWPIAALWAAKQLSLLIVSNTITAAMQKRKVSKEMKEFQKRLQKELKAKSFFGLLKKPNE